MKYEARRLGVPSAETCKNCHSTGGNKLGRENLEELSLEFFVSGSAIRAQFGAAQRIEFNDTQEPGQNINVSKNLHADAQLIESALGVAFFLYGPPLWMLGENQHLKNILKGGETANKTLSKILSKYPVKKLTPGEHFFKLRSNLKNPLESSHFDAAPHGLSKARLNADGSRMLYASQDLEVCIHECRISLADEVYVATLTPVKELLMLDLTTDIEDGETPFESLDIAPHFLFRAESHAYDACTTIAQAAKTKFDGIIFPSYFSQIKENIIPNIAIFGAPIAEKRLQVLSINRLLIKSATYDYRFGPAMTSDPESAKSKLNQLLTNLRKKLKNLKAN